MTVATFAPEGCVVSAVELGAVFAVGLSIGRRLQASAGLTKVSEIGKTAV